MCSLETVKCNYEPYRNTFTALDVKKIKTELTAHKIHSYVHAVFNINMIYMAIYTLLFNQHDLPETLLWFVLHYKLWVAV